MFTALPTPLPFLDDKRLVILGTADATRLPTLPNVPTLAEAGLPGFEFSAWAALLAPAGTPPEIIDRLNAAANAALSDPEVHKQLTALGYEVVGGPPSALAALIERDYQAKGDILRAANIHADSAARRGYPPGRTAGRGPRRRQPHHAARHAGHGCEAVEQRHHHHRPGRRDRVGRPGCRRHRRRRAPGRAGRYQLDPAGVAALFP